MTSWRRTTTCRSSCKDRNDLEPFKAERKGEQGTRLCLGTETRSPPLWGVWRQDQINLWLPNYLHPVVCIKSRQISLKQKIIRFVSVIFFRSFKLSKLTYQTVASLSYLLLSTWWSPMSSSWHHRSWEERGWSLRYAFIRSNINHVYSLVCISA